MIRGKLASVVEQLDPDLGVQVNRSVWVSRRQITHAQMHDARSITLFLTDGTDVLVARPRLPLVKDCLKRWHIDTRDERTASGFDTQGPENLLDEAS